MRVTKEYSRNKSWKIALIVGIVVLAVAVIAGYIIIEQVDILDLVVIITILIPALIWDYLPCLLIIVGLGIAVKLILTRKKDS